MAEPKTEQPKEEVKISPVGEPAKGGKNKDGFVKGQIVGQKEYFEAIAKQRLKK